jgi:hypothetical protein
MSSALLSALGGVVIIAVAVALRRARFVFWGMALLGGAYVLWLPRHQGVGEAVTAPLVAAALMSCGEAVFLAIEGGRAYVGRRILWLAGTALGSITVSAIVLVVATIHLGRSVATTIVGTVAAVAVVALLSALSARKIRGA